MKNRMPQQYKEAWIKALRSGDYKQGIGILHENTHDTYCCLGVLQHCIDGNVEIESNNLSYCLPTMEWIRNHGIEWVDRSGSYNPYPTFIVNHTLITAYRLNDIIGFSFEQIADLIEEQIEGY